jgi:hypothetical protein
VARSLIKDEWVVYAAFLPALVTAAGVAITAAMAWHAQAPWHVPAASQVCASADDYVQGLAKHGIVRLPGYEVAPPDELSTVAVIAEAELRARHIC